MTDQTQGGQAGGEAPAPGSDAYNTQMAAAYDNQSAPQTRDSVPLPPKPEGGHDKFYDSKTGAYNWEAHAREVEFNATRSKTQPPQGEQTPQDQQPTDPSAAPKLDMSAVVDEFTKTGKIGDTNRAALESAGVPAEMVENYIQMAEQNAKLTVQNQVAYGGGKDAVDKMFAWAKNNLSADEIAAYDEALASPNWQMAMDSLKARSGVTGAQAPQLLNGSFAAPMREPGFADQNEMARAMQDPRYRTDPAYRRSVMERVALMQG